MSGMRKVEDYIRKLRERCRNMLQDGEKKDKDRELRKRAERGREWYRTKEEETERESGGGWWWRVRLSSNP